MKQHPAHVRQQGLLPRFKKRLVSLLTWSAVPPRTLQVLLMVSSCSAWFSSNCSRRGLLLWLASDHASLVTGRDFYVSPIVWIRDIPATMLCPTATTVLLGRQPIVVAQFLTCLNIPYRHDPDGALGDHGCGSAHRNG